MGLFSRLFFGLPSSVEHFVILSKSEKSNFTFVYVVAKFLKNMFLILTFKGDIP